MLPVRVEANASDRNGDDSKKSDRDVVDTIQLENLFIRDADMFQTSLNSEDYLDSLAPLITDALKANALADFITKLNDIVLRKDTELNELSLSSAHDINACIDAIDEVSRQSDDLNGNLVRVNEGLNASVHDLIAKKKALVKCKDTEQKITDTIVMLNLCIHVLEITNKIHDWIKQNRYFSALKLIDELTTIHLMKVKDFSFSVKIHESIPHLTSMIKDESFDSLCKCLSTQIERKIDVIADHVFQNLTDLQDNWEKLRNDPDNLSLLPHRLNSAIELSMRDPTLNLDIFSSNKLAIPLALIYDCILVYQSLNEMPVLSTAYHKEWMKKYERIIYPITLSSANEKLALYHEPIVTFPDLSALNAYLQKIAAFFVVDKQLNTRTKFELRTNATSDDLWESFATKLKPVLLQFLNKRKWGLDDLGALADFKDCIGNFIQVMENSQYKIMDLYEILILTFKSHFCPIIIQHFRLEFLESIQSDHYMPLVVTNKQDYDSVMRICWYKNDASFAPKNVKALPISFPFSEDYVHYCLGIRTLLQDIIDFTSRHYSYDMTELNQIIINDIFERVLGDEPGVGICKDMREFITKNANNKEIVAQSYTNLEYYLFSLYEVGKLIDRKLRVYNGIGIVNIDTNSTFKLKAIELFSNVRKFSEHAIFNMVDQKVKELLDMLEYNDWMPQTKNTDPNFFILDFSLFLENLFNSIFSNLPTTFRTLGLLRSFDFISNYLLEMLANVPRFNHIAIENFDLDIRHLEELLAKLNSSSNSEDQDDDPLVSTFAPLRQSIDLLLSDNYDEFIKNLAYRMRRYDRLKYEDALNLIKKMYVEDPNADNASLYALDNNSVMGLERETSILGGSAAKFAKWGKFRKTDP